MDTSLEGLQIEGEELRIKMLEYDWVAYERGNQREEVCCQNKPFQQISIRKPTGSRREG